MEILDYNIINDVYGNFISFQEFLSNELTELDSNKELEILEIGTGTGITTEIILKSRKNIKLTSIDIDKEMIEFASQTLSSFSNVNFIVSDAFDYTKTISANNFDFVVSGFTIHNFTNNYRQILFNEIYRILKPKGIFINADKFVSDNKEKQIQGLKYRIGTYIDTLVPLGKIDLLKEWVAHYIDDQNPNKLLKFDQTINDLQQIGFDNMKYIFKSELEMLGVLTATKQDALAITGVLQKSGFSAKLNIRNSNEQ